MSMYVLSIMHKILYKNEYEFAFTNSIFFSIGSSSSADLSKNTVFIPEKKDPSRTRIMNSHAGSGHR